MKQLRLAICAILFLGLFSCGYQFQGRHNPLKEVGIEKVYVTQFRNYTYRPGIEQLFSTALIREIQKSGSFRLVDSKEAADAVILGEVTAVDANPSSSRSENIGTNKSLDVASEYSASVHCSVLLIDKSGREIFSKTVSSSKIFPGATRTGEESATNPLVVESEQRLAIQFLASEMMASVYQRMIDTF